MESANIYMQLDQIRYSVDKYIVYCHYDDSAASLLSEMDKNRDIIISFIIDNWMNLNYTEYEVMMISGVEHDSVFDFILYVHVNSRIKALKEPNCDIPSIVKEQYLELLKIKSGYSAGIDYWKKNK